MEELIFFGIIILFSIIDSIAKSRKAKRAGKQPQTSERQAPEHERAGWRGDGDEERPSHDSGRRYEPAPTYDTEPTYDDAERVHEEVVTYDDIAADRPDERPAREEARPSAAGMIPSDLWEEIAGLARESSGVKTEPARQRPSRPAPRAPSRLPSKPPVPAKAPAPSKSPTPSKSPVPSGPEIHPIHLTHTDFGTDPSERVRSVLSAARLDERTVSRDVRAVRAQLGGDTHALRRAMILHEVLAPPASMRSEPFED